MTNQSDAKAQRFDATKNAWIERVLGVRVPNGPMPPQSTGGDFASRWLKAATQWKTASDIVNGQIGTLQGKLLRSSDGRLRRIGEFGLNGITGNHKVHLMAAMTEVDGALSDAAALPPAASRAKKIVDAFKTHVATDRMVALCDDNPFGVQMSLRETLVPALSAMADALGTAARQP